ncbi:MAG: hypothetical protein HQK50_14525 [Oligoflexia bacterium]|nr:hypothetical protein [Oligoflexia bacterium]MBF0366786.1 hypothetical protein [Oligoflexia bacterium]
MIKELFSLAFYQKKNVRNTCFMAMAAFFTLFGYECVRSTSTVLFKNSFGNQNLPLVLALTPFVLLPMLYLYSFSLKKFGPQKTLIYSTTLSSIIFILLYQLATLELKWPIVLLYLLREGYIVLLIEQYWSFINSSIESQEAKKLNGIVTALSGIGGVLGGIFVHAYAKKWGAVPLILVMSGTTLCSLIPALVAYKNSDVDVLKKKELPPQKDGLGLSFILSERTLLLIMLLMIFCQFYSVVVFLNFETALQAAYPQTNEQTSFAGLFYAYVNAGAFVCQLLIAPYLLHRLRPALIHLTLPLLHLLTFLFIFIHPSIESAALAFFLFKTTEYSLFRAAKEILYIPFPDDVRFRTKEFIDVFCHRTSKSGISFLISLCSKAGILVGQSFYLALIPFALLGWLISSLFLCKKSN